MTAVPLYLSTAFGLRWQSDIELPHFESTDPHQVESTDADIRVFRVPELAVRHNGAQVRVGEVYVDGTRFPWAREATFDTYSGVRVEYLAGPEWKGALPYAFYSTVTAHILAWRGIVPFHACAVEIGGKAFLIAGKSGTGKSSLAVGLSGLGATLLSDDLTAIVLAGDRAEVAPGRTSLRIGPEIAQCVEGDRFEAPLWETRGKQVIHPARRSSNRPVPLGGMVVLGGNPGLVPPLARCQLFSKQLFRPVWLAAFPNHRTRQQELIKLAPRVPTVAFPPVAGGGMKQHYARARDALALIEAMAGLRGHPPPGDVLGS